MTTRQLSLEMLELLNDILSSMLQRKLENLVKLLDNDERYQEAHVIRIIIKPHLEEMNRRKWTNMTAMEKLKSLFS